MGSDTPEPRTDRVRRRLPVFGLLGAVSGFALYLALMNSGSAIAESIAQAPGWVYVLPRYSVEWPSLHRLRILSVEDMGAMLTVNLAVWSLLGLAAGVLLAVRRPRRLQQSEGTR